jgi:hypothetical protein
MSNHAQKGAFFRGAEVLRELTFRLAALGATVFLRGLGLVDEDLVGEGFLLAKS